jgi:hypothetical protein
VNLERASFACMALGLLGIGQPFVHAFFVLGFPLTLLGVVLYNAAAVLAKRDKEGG